MCSYNKINNTWACENDQILNKDLKGRMGFKGFVMSDWGATHSTIQSANSGLDMEMPDSYFFGAPLVQAVNDGKVSMSRIDDMVLRILTSAFAVGLFDRPASGNLSVDATSAAHNKLARELSEAGTVLLKNDKSLKNGNILLPLDVKNIRSIAIIGDDGNSTKVAGGGSGGVIPAYVITPFDGIRSRLARTHPNIKVTYAPTNPIPNAAKVAAAADVAIVFASTFSSEGSDRPNLFLDKPQDELIGSVSAAQSNVIVVAKTPGAVLMPWIHKVPAILCALMPGQEYGNAIASILVGDVNPSGKLPVTFPMTQQQIPTNTQQQYPGINNQADYTEGLLVGYRWYDAHNIKPLFPFGHGLSYTTFNYSQIKATAFQVSVTVGNTGSRSGAEVAQLYLGYPASAGEPPKVLRAFEKISLEPGEYKEIILPLSNRDLSIWDVTKQNWKLIRGKFNIYVGSSSRDIRASTVLNIH